MTRESDMTISRYLIAALLLGASALQPSFAGDTKVGDRPGKAHEPKRLIATSAGPQNNAERHLRAIANALHIERNAIGLATERHERVPGPAPDVAGPRSIAPVVSAPVAAAAAANHLVSPVAVKEDDSIARPDVVRPHTAPQAVVPSRVSHSAINGTTLIRPIHAPAVIGGPAKVAASINGTTIRLKH
jgi:hypothetical protein